MGELEDKLRSYEWPYAAQDPAALAELGSRIATVGRRRGLITYSQLVDGVIFHLAEVRDGGPYHIDIGNWKGIDRRIVSDFLGRIDVDSYLATGFMASALVVRKDERVPSKRFFKWMEELKLIPRGDEDAALTFWARQKELAYT